MVTLFLIGLLCMIIIPILLIFIGGIGGVVLAVLYVVMDIAIGISIIAVPIIAVRYFMRKEVEKNEQR